jgi:hypothetical protein
MDKYISDNDISRFNNFLKGPGSDVFYRIGPDLPPVEEIFHDHVYYAVLFQENPDSHIGHWVCLIKISENQFEYFDCLGKTVPPEVNNILHDYKERNGLTELELYSTNRSLMNPKGYICGKWTMLRIMTLPSSLNAFIGFFDSLIGKVPKKGKPNRDQIVDFLISIPYGYKD